MLSPASLLEPLCKMSSNCSIVILPLPTSISVPTTALTMFRKNQLAVISKYQVVGEVCTHRACVTWQMVVLLSPPALQKAA